MYHFIAHTIGSAVALKALGATPACTQNSAETCPLDFRKNPLSKKACHCSIVFLQRTLQLFARLKYFVKKLCPCRKTKSGLAPPFA